MEPGPLRRLLRTPPASAPARRTRRPPGPRAFAGGGFEAHGHRRGEQFAAQRHHLVPQAEAVHRHRARNDRHGRPADFHRRERREDLVGEAQLVAFPREAADVEAEVLAGNQLAAARRRRNVAIVCSPSARPGSFNSPAAVRVPGLLPRLQHPALRCATPAAVRQTRPSDRTAAAGSGSFAGSADTLPRTRPPADARRGRASPDRDTARRRWRLRRQQRAVVDPDFVQQADRLRTVVEHEPVGARRPHGISGRAVGAARELAVDIDADVLAAPGEHEVEPAAGMHLQRRVDEVQAEVLVAEIQRRLVFAAVEQVEDERLVDERAVPVGEVVDAERSQPELQAALLAAEEPGAVIATRPAKACPRTPGRNSRPAQFDLGGGAARSRGGAVQRDMDRPAACSGAKQSGPATIGLRPLRDRSRRCPPAARTCGRCDARGPGRAARQAGVALVVVADVHRLRFEFLLVLHFRPSPQWIG